MSKISVYLIFHYHDYAQYVLVPTFFKTTRLLTTITQPEPTLCTELILYQITKKLLPLLENGEARTETNKNLSIQHDIHIFVQPYQYAPHTSWHVAVFAYNIVTCTCRHHKPWAILKCGNILYHPHIQAPPIQSRSHRHLYMYNQIVQSVVHLHRRNERASLLGATEVFN